MFFDIYWFLNGSRDILCHVQSPYKMSHLSPFTCQQNIRIPDVDISKLDKQKLNQSSTNPTYRSRNQWTIFCDIGPFKKTRSGMVLKSGPTVVWSVVPWISIVLKFQTIVDSKFQIFHDFEIFGRIGIFVGDQRASERKHVTRKFWISNRISQNDYNIRTIIFIQKAIIFMNFQRIMPNKINMGRGAELSQREQVFFRKQGLCWTSVEVF